MARSGAISTRRCSATGREPLYSSGFSASPGFSASLDATFPASRSIIAAGTTGVPESSLTAASRRRANPRAACERSTVLPPRSISSRSGRAPRMARLAVATNLLRPIQTEAAPSSPMTSAARRRESALSWGSISRILPSSKVSGGYVSVRRKRSSISGITDSRTSKSIARSRAPPGCEKIWASAPIEAGGSRFAGSGKRSRKNATCSIHARARVERWWKWSRAPRVTRTNPSGSSTAGPVCRSEGAGRSAAEACSKRARNDSAVQVASWAAIDVSSAQRAKASGGARTLVRSSVGLRMKAPYIHGGVHPPSEAPRLGYAALRENAAFAPGDDLRLRRGPPFAAAGPRPAGLDRQPVPVRRGHGHPVRSLAVRRPRSRRGAVLLAPGGRGVPARRQLPAHPRSARRGARPTPPHRPFPLDRNDAGELRGARLSRDGPRRRVRADGALRRHRHHRPRRDPRDPRARRPAGGAACRFRRAPDPRSHRPPSPPAPSVAPALAGLAPGRAPARALHAQAPPGRTPRPRPASRVRGT